MCYPSALTVASLEAADHNHVPVGLCVRAETLDADPGQGLAKVAADGVPGHQPGLQVLQGEPDKRWQTFELRFPARLTSDLRNVGVQRRKERLIINDRTADGG